MILRSVQKEEYRLEKRASRGESVELAGSFPGGVKVATGEILGGDGDLLEEGSSHPKLKGIFPYLQISCGNNCLLSDISSIIETAVLMVIIICQRSSP